MDNIKILLIEDATQIEVDLNRRLKEMNFEVKYHIPSLYDIHKYLKKGDVDIVLTDSFLLEKENGISIAENIISNYNLPVIIFSGEENITFENIKNSNAYTIMQKPLRDLELKFNINSAVDRYKRKALDNNIIFVRAKHKIIKINFENIYYLESDKDYVIIRIGEEKIKINTSLKEFLKVLPNNKFIRTHRRFIVNIEKISVIKFPEIKFEQIEDIVQIGGNYKKLLLNNINLL